MTLVGLIVCGAGVVGFVVNYMGLAALPGVMSDQRVWVGMMVIGAITALLTRRASD